MAYPNRLDTIGYLADSELAENQKSYPAGSQSVMPQILYPVGRELRNGFSPTLTWSHYRALMRVNDEKARNFYEQEAIDCGWTKAQLERQIQSSYYQRILSNRVITSYSIHYTKLYELADLQIDQQKALEHEIVENQIDVEILIVATDMFLPGDKGETLAQLQQKRLQVVDDSVITSYSIHYTKLYDWTHGQTSKWHNLSDGE